MNTEDRVRRHAAGYTDKVTLRSFFPGARRWFAPWTRGTSVGFTLAGGTPTTCADRFEQFAAELREDALRPGFRGGFVEWVSIRDHWTGVEDLNWLWRTVTPVEMRRLTISADLTVIDTGAISRELL